MVERVIEVVAYDPSWPVAFDELRGRYADALAGVAVVGIEHVGSTSVPGLDAKPVIDVDIVVRRDDVDAAIAALVAIGCTSRGDQGIAERYALRAPRGWPRTHTYVVVEGSLALRNHRAVRDVLRADVGLRDAYGALKHQLVANTDDIDEYVEAKSSLLRRILARGGLTPAELDTIQAANRAS